MNKRRLAGLSIVEVIMAISIIAIMFAVLTPALIDNSKRTAITGQTAQASLLLNYFVRQVVVGNSDALADTNTPLIWDYGALGSSPFNLASEGDLANPDSYKVIITNQGVQTMLGAQVTQYETQVCFEQQADEVCVAAYTLGPDPLAVGSGTFIPGIN